MVIKIELIYYTRIVFLIVSILKYYELKNIVTALRIL